MKDFSPVAGWDDIVAQVNEKYPATGCFLKGSSAFSHQNILLLTVNNEFFKEKFKKGRDAALLNEILKANFGQTFNIKVRSASNGDVRAESPLSALVMIKVISAKGGRSSEHTACLPPKRACWVCTDPFPFLNHTCLFLHLQTTHLLNSPSNLPGGYLPWK